MKYRWKSITALALALVLIFALVAQSGTAQAVDLAQLCGLTVHSGDVEAEANVVVDLYLVASAEAVAGYDTYSYSAAPAYAGLSLNGVEDVDVWDALARQAADIALDGTQTPAATGSVDAEIPELAAGLYLVVAHGDGMTDYVRTVTDENGDSRKVTIAQTSDAIYSFAPVLVSLPTKEKNAETGLINTADPGPWLYNGEITLKYEKAPRFGSLEIIKNLTGYVEGKPATFVFEIEATLDGRVVYSNVVTMTFTGAGDQSVIVDHIPVGAEVTVREVYTGSVYQLVSDPDQNTVISAEDIVSVSFTNRPTDSGRDGGAVTNRFSYVKDENGNLGWSWTPIPDVP